MNSKKFEISDFFWVPTNVSSHVLPYVGFFQELESRGLDLDFYKPKEMLSGRLKSLGKNHFEFVEFDSKEEAGWIGILECVFLMVSWRPFQPLKLYGKREIRTLKLF